jgi:sugar lactone lactonase YvrE
MLRRSFAFVSVLILFATAAHATDVEVVAKLTEPPGNIAVTPDGRIIVSVHQIYGRDLRVIEVLPDGSVRPFPNAAWNEAPESGNMVGLYSVLGVRADRDGRVWLLDNAVGAGATPKLVAWDTDTDSLSRVIHVPGPVTSEKPYLNDLAVDLDHGAIYIANPSRDGRPSIQIIDIATGLTRTVLENHASVVAEDVPIVIDGQRLRIPMPDGSMRDPRLGINPITIDSANEWLYYGPMSGNSLYRVRTSDLLDTSLSDEQLGGRVERYGDKSPCGGITVDDAGNVYITDMSAKGVGVTRPDGSYELLYTDDDLLDWPDGFATGPDGYIYAAVNRLHKTAKLNGGVNESEPPYYVVRFPALAPVTIGR